MKTTKSIKQWACTFNRLVMAGKRYQAMELFYASELPMGEHNIGKRFRKEVCLAHEMENMKQAKQMTCVLLNQSIDDIKNRVTSEWIVVFTDLNGQYHKLVEVSVQHWKNGLIVRELFYYRNTTSDNRGTYQFLLK